MAALTSAARADIGAFTSDPPRRRSTLWRWVAAVEVVGCAVAVVLDLALPSLVILLVMVVSLLVRREHLSTLGMRRLDRPWRTAGIVLALSVGWTVAVIALFMPVLEHLTGEQQDVSAFVSLEGDVARLAVLLALSWTLAAVGEELAFRGFVLTRVADAIGPGTFGVVAGVLVSSTLFALIHTEQGTVGVCLTFLDALFFAALRLHYRSLWAAVLAHGFNNTIGMTAYFLVGPIYALW